MTAFAEKIGRAYDMVIKGCLVIACALSLFTVLSVTADVLLRNFWGRPLRWSLEINEIILLYITFLGAPWALQKNKHVRMDLLVQRLNERAQITVKAVMHLLAALFSFILTYYGIITTIDQFKRRIYGFSLLEIPNVYILWVIPLGFFLMAIQFLRMSFHSFRTYKTLEESKKVQRDQQGVIQ